MANEAVKDPQEDDKRVENCSNLKSTESRSEVKAEEDACSGKLNGSALNNKLKHVVKLPELEDKKQNEVKKPPVLKSVRYYVIALALVCPFVTTYSKTIINFAITDMIDPEFKVVRQQQQTNLTLDNHAPYFDLDHSCPVTNEDERNRLLREMTSDTERARSGPGDKFKWDTFYQGLLKSAYSIGSMLFQIPGSRLSEMYGAHRVLSAGAFLITISCLLAPYLAAIHFYLMFADLILLGIWGSFMTPALITLSINWLTHSEKSVLISLHMVASRLGYALSSILCGLLIHAQYSWRYVFFSAGWVASIFGALVFLGTRSRPQDHPFIGQRELQYLASKNTLVKEALDKAKMEKQVDYELKEVVSDGDAAKAVDDVRSSKSTPEEKAKKGAPWLAIITNVPVIAFVVTKFCLKLSTDTIQIELPSYLKRVMHFTAKDNGMLNSLNYVIFCGGCLTVGTLAAKLNKARPFGISKTTLRKIFQSISSFGVALILVGIAFSVCDNFATQAYLMILFFVTTFAIGGEAQMPMDLTERYSGTLHAIASSLAISGVIEPTLVGYLLRGHPADRHSWKYVWLGASTIAFTGGLVFLLFGSAEVQPFDNLHVEDGVEEEKMKTKRKIGASNGKENGAFEHDVELKNGQKSHRESIQI